MGKITCEVINDLLPLYCDEVCTPDSRRIVEEHLENCADCRSLLEKMKLGGLLIKELEEMELKNFQVKNFEYIKPESLRKKGFEDIKTESLWKKGFEGIKTESIQEKKFKGIKSESIQEKEFEDIKPKDMQKKEIEDIKLENMQEKEMQGVEQKEPLTIEEMQRDKIIRDMAEVWKKSVIRSFVKGLCAALCGCVVLYAAYWGLIRWPVNVVQPEDVEAEAVVEDSRFTVNIMTIDGYKATSVDIVNEKDGKMYIMLKRGIIPMKNGNGAVYGGSYSGDLDAQLETGETVRIKEIYYGTPGGSVLLWKAG